MNEERMALAVRANMEGSCLSTRSRTTVAPAPGTGCERTVVSGSSRNDGVVARDRESASRTRVDATRAGSTGEEDEGCRACATGAERAGDPLTPRGHRQAGGTHASRLLPARPAVTGDSIPP
ncbi:hypothetical protein MTS1_01851 [Microbacterium sp. TS-1]|nr:hypothetical protein MTS1_01851 [Microbacterium sp. TS-1]